MKNLKKIYTSSIIFSYLLLFVSPINFADDSAQVEKWNKFNLFTNCSPMAIAVEELSKDADSISLTKDSIQANIESRLRSARLYVSDKNDFFGYLYVNVNVSRYVFNLSLRYNKYVYDDFTEIYSFATTWQVGILGSHGDDAGYILSALSRVMDEFLVEYLRVNEGYCG